LNFVDLSIFPHLNHVDFSDNTMENAELCAAILEHPAYAMDNQTAIRFEKGVAEVISEYEWIEYN